MVEIVKMKTGYFQFTIIAKSGGSLLKSKPFKKHIEAKAALIKAVANPIFERKTNHQGKFVIALKTPEGEQIGQSNTYTSEAGMENGIKNLMNILSKS